MTKITINGATFSGDDIRIDRNVLWIDGAEAARFDDPALDIEADGPITAINADRPVRMRSTAKGGQAAVAVDAGFDAEAFQKTMREAFPPGFPFHTDRT